MENIKQELIDKIIEELKRECVEDIAFIIAPLHQSLDDEKYKDFMEDLKDKKTFFVNYEKPQEDDYYTNGTITISMQNKEPDECMNYFTNYNYEISFDEDERDWGYCECGKDDTDYDSRHDCCGHGCDWTAPAFSIRKNEFIGKSSWNGDAHDFWDFEDKFNNVDEKQKEEAKKIAEINYIKKQIENLTNQLNKIIGK